MAKRRATLMAIFRSQLQNDGPAAGWPPHHRDGHPPRDHDGHTTGFPAARPRSGYTGTAPGSRFPRAGGRYAVEATRAYLNLGDEVRQLRTSGSWRPTWPDRTCGP